MWIIYFFIFIVLLLLIFSKLILNLVFGKRNDGNPKLKYFTSDDFEGLEAKKIRIKSNKGQILGGNIYTIRGIKKYKGIIVFAHGMGGGHLSYTTEINTFAKAGFMVIGYDNTGTFSSEGKNLKGFFQAVIDLKYVLKYIEESENLSKYPVELVGHSWGAYTVCQVLQFKTNVKAVVAISGFNNSSKIISDTIKNKMKFNCSFLNIFFTILNFITFGRKGIKNTVDVLEKTNIPVLLLHGQSDITVNMKNSLIIDNRKLSDKINIKKIIYKEKFHNVYQTRESEKYLNTVFGEISSLNKKYKGKTLEDKINKIYESIDYKKMTEEDLEVMNTIISFLEEAILHTH